MFNYYTVLSNISTEFASNSAITDWVSTNYPTKSLRVYLSVDPANLPTIEDGPLIVVESFNSPTDAGQGNVNMGLSPAIRTPGILIGFSIYNNEQTSVSGVNVQTGMRLVNEFGKLVYDTLETYVNNTMGYELEYADYELDPVIAFPEWGGFIYASIRGDRTLTSEPFSEFT